MGRLFCAVFPCRTILDALSRHILLFVLAFSLIGLLIDAEHDNQGHYLNP